MADIRIGTSAFTAAGWPRTFYPDGLPEREYLTYYASKFDTVEVDSTFYRTPSLQTVKGWNAKTPPGFVFAAKVPQIISTQNGYFRRIGFAFESRAMFGFKVIAHSQRAQAFYYVFCWPT